MGSGNQLKGPRVDPEDKSLSRLHHDGLCPVSQTGPVIRRTNEEIRRTTDCDSLRLGFTVRLLRGNFHNIINVALLFLDNVFHEELHEYKKKKLCRMGFFGFFKNFLFKMTV